VLLGMAGIYVETATATANGTLDWVRSQRISIDNPGGYGFVGEDLTLKILDLQSRNQTGVEQLIKEIELGQFIVDSVATPDLARVFVAVSAMDGKPNGIHVIDGVSLRPVDMSASTPGIDPIALAYGSPRALALDPAGRYLYVAAGSSITVIDIRPGATLHQVVQVIPVATQAGINDIAVNADGTRLWLTAPSAQPWYSNADIDGELIVINIDENDRPPADAQGNPRAWREVIGRFDGKRGPEGITATSDPARMAFVSFYGSSGVARNEAGSGVIRTAFPERLDGLHTVTVTNNSPTSFAVRVNSVSLDLSPDFDQYYQLDVHNPHDVVVLPDLSYAFVSDWAVPILSGELLDPAYWNGYESNHGVGAKVAIIKDPFGPGARIVAATTPIPYGFATELRLSSDASKLYVTYQGAGDVLVFDVANLIATVNATDAATLAQQPIDQLGAGINLPAIAIAPGLRGLSLQTLDPLKLISPVGTESLHDGAVLGFEWLVDTGLLGRSDFTAQVFVSTLRPGEGLWPDDPMTLRDDSSDTYPGYSGSDNNPNRIWTSQPMNGATRMELPFSPALLTAGQRYYWGVKIVSNGESYYESASFVAAPLRLDTPYNGVTLITHGFALGATADEGLFSQPEQFLALGKLVAAASGGGVVLSYNKNTGQWVDRQTGLAGVDALRLGEAVVLVADWNKESDISDSGFSEAAADAMYASLVALDRASAGALFASPLHLIGHSRGTVVNSEIVQRLGTWNPEIDDIHMTTLDPHDFVQDSLKVPLETVLNYANVGLGVAAAASSLATPGFSAFLLSLKLWLGRALTVADVFGIALDIPYDDFKDPDVQRWENLGFFDNYYQTVAKASGFTVTPNGRFIPGADISLFMDGLAGFTQDDFGLFGVGGAHSRVWQWYAGTVATDLLAFEGNPVFRRIVDEGVSSRALDIPVFDFNARPWYWTLPGGNPLLSTPWTEPGAIWEGVSNGWYFSVVGGGESVRPDGLGVPVPVGTDNTEVTRAADAVPNVFNGNFEYGTRQSLLKRLDPAADKFRFPLSYELPGWSFHGGEGFTVDFPGVGALDIAGLFVVETDVSTLASGALGKIWDLIADATIGALANKAKLDTLGGEPAAPTASSSAGYQEWYALNWGANTRNRALMDTSSALYDLVATAMQKLVDAGIAASPLQDLIRIDDKALNPFGVENFKSYVSAGLELLFKEMFGGGSNHAMLMGAGALIADWLKLTLDDVGGDFWNSIIEQVVKLDTLTHNRLAVPADQPYLVFSVAAPVMVTPGAQLKVRFLATGLDSGPEDSEWAVVNLETKFFSRSNYSVVVPEEFRGRTALLQFQFDRMEGETEVSFDDLGTLFDTGFPALGQLFFLDDIRFSKGLEATVTPHIAEGQEVRLDVSWVPIDPLQDTTLSIDWQDGSAPETRVVAAGVRIARFTHVYVDDNPTGTSLDRQAMIVSASNVVGVGEAFAFTEIRNVAPHIGLLVSYPEFLEEGDEFRLEGGFSDPGLADTFRLSIDWGDGSAVEVYQNLPALENSGGGSFNLGHRYVDDNPSRTPQDVYTVTVTIEDDDGGMHRRSIDVLVRNAVPVIEDASLNLARVLEGEVAELTVRYSDRGLRDTLSMQVEWPDGVRQNLILPLDASGNGVVSISHVLQDDNPSNTAEDLGQVRIRIEDDDRGVATRTLDLTVVNQPPTLNALLVAPVIDEGGTAVLQLEITDPGLRDTFKVWIDWDDGSNEQELSGIAGVQLISHVYLDDTPSSDGIGTRNVKVRVQDDDGGSASTAVALEVSNIAPEAIASADIVVAPGQMFSLVGGYSDPGVLDSVSYQWALVDSLGAFVSGSTAASPTFQLLDPGMYTALLQVRDDDGGVSAPVSSRILVPGNAELAGLLWEIALAPDAVNEGDLVTLSVQIAGVASAGQYTLDMDFGDGTRITNVAVPAADASGVTLLSFDHRYADDRAPGQSDSYTVDVRLFFEADSFRGELGQRSESVEVLNLDPQVSISVTAPQAVGGAHQLSGAFSDAGLADTHTILWDLGDGTRISGSLLASHVFTRPATVTLRITDDDGGIGLASVFIPVPLAAGSAGQGGTDTLSLQQIVPLAFQAQSLWLEAGADIVPLDNIVFEIADLPGTLLALVSLETGTTRLVLDIDAAGHGWFVDPTPVFSEEFAGVISAEARFAATGAASGRMDLLTVLAHEFGHILGLSHIDETVAPNSVMVDALPLGMRRIPLGVDLVRAQGGFLLNGGFSIADQAFYEYGWNTGGSASVRHGEGVLAENAQRSSRLSQTFRLPPGAASLQFTITGGQMRAVAGLPADAFEVALLDPRSMDPLSATIGFTDSDAFFNLQSDGSVYLAPTVTMTDLAGNPLATIDFTTPVRVTLDLGGVSAGADAALFFELLGFGALDSEVRIDDVRFIGAQTINQAPIARTDRVNVAEDGSLLIDVLGNDSDADGDFLAVLAVGAASRGSVSIESGRIRYVPVADFAGSDRFDYTIVDSAGNSASATVLVTIDPVNDAPLLSPIPDYRLVEGLPFSVLAAASDIDSAELNFRLDNAPDGASIDARSGRIDWIAARAGVDALFTVTVDDGQAQASRSFRVSVLPDAAGNLAPIAADDIVTLIQGSSTTIDVLANDIDPEGGPLALQAVGVAANGTVSIENGMLRYRPDERFSGSDRFSYTIVDSAGNSATANVSVTVMPGNRAPVLQPLGDLVLIEGSQLLLQLNAEDADGDELAYRFEQAPEGAVIDAASGRISWLAAVPGQRAEFTVTVSDGLAETSGSFQVQVLPSQPLNLPPVAGADSVSLFQDRSVLVDVLANDVDPEGQPLLLGSLTQPAHGRVAFENGRVRYTPTAGYIGADSFSYSVFDNAGASSLAIVSVQVRPSEQVNRAPLAMDDSVVMAEDDSIIIDVLANDSDADGDALGIIGISAPAHGIALIENGRIRYTPSPDYHGIDQLVYLVGDGRGGEDTARVMITVTPVNDPPRANDDLATVVEDGSVLIDVLANDMDIDGDVLALFIVGAPAHGSVVVEDGKIRYTPLADYHGSDSFSYEVRDAAGGSQTAQVRVTVAAVNDAPALEAVLDARVSRGSLVTIQLRGTDVDDDELVYRLLQGPADASIDADTGLLSWRASGAGSTQGFTVSVRDPSGAEATRSFNVQVRLDTIDAGLNAAVPLVASSGSMPLLAPPPSPRSVAGEVAVLGFEAPGGLASLLMPRIVEGSGRTPMTLHRDDGTQIRLKQPMARDPRLLLWVERFVPLLNGFAVRFSDRIVAAPRDPDAHVGSEFAATAVVIKGPGGELLQGTLEFDADGRGFRFLFASGPVQPGVYEIVLRSGLDGFHSFFGMLDGDGDGLPGGDFQQRLELPQAASVPADGAASAGDQQESLPLAEAPRVDIAGAFSGFELAGSLAFAAGSRRVDGARPRRWLSDVLGGNEAVDKKPNHSLSIRLRP